jgi:hypothetical protein
MDEGVSFFVLDLVMMEAGDPRLLLLMSRVCRRCNEHYKQNTYWFRFRNNVCKRLPCLRSTFELWSHEHLWWTFAKRLWVNESRLLFLSLRVREAIVIAGHGHPERISRVSVDENSSVFCNIKYADGGVTTVWLERTYLGNHYFVDLRKSIDTTPVPTPTSKLVCKSNRVTNHHGFLEGRFIETASQTGLPMSVLWGPYMDIVLCNPKGRRFRDRTGVPCGPLVTDNFFYFERDTRLSPLPQ